nr:hypothetical protein CFP56_33714 [Quercus suber]
MFFYCRAPVETGGRGAAAPSTKAVDFLVRANAANPGRMMPDPIVIGANATAAQPASKFAWQIRLLGRRHAAIVSATAVARLSTMLQSLPSRHTSPSAPSLVLLTPSPPVDAACSIHAD